MDPSLVEVFAPECREGTVRQMFADPHFLKCALDCYEVYGPKNRDYSGDETSFNRAARVVGVTPNQAWGVHFEKHIAAVWQFVREGQVESEPIQSRLHDVINYAILLLGLLEENKGGK